MVGIFITFIMIYKLLIIVFTRFNRKYVTKLLKTEKLY